MHPKLRSKVLSIIPEIDALKSWYEMTKEILEQIPEDEVYEVAEGILLRESIG